MEHPNAAASGVASRHHGDNNVHNNNVDQDPNPPAVASGDTTSHSDSDEEGAESNVVNRASRKRPVPTSALTTDIPTGTENPLEAPIPGEEGVKLEQRRAYNRMCAAKARKRSKDLIATLQTQVSELTRDKAELQRNNEVMRAQLTLLEQQNRTLLVNGQRGSLPMPPVAPMPSAMGNVNMFLNAAAATGVNPFLLPQSATNNMQNAALLEALAGGQHLLNFGNPNTMGNSIGDGASLPPMAVASFLQQPQPQQPLQLFQQQKHPAMQVPLPTPQSASASQQPQSTPQLTEQQPLQSQPPPPAPAIQPPSQQRAFSQH
jgi:hypothetical protein